MGQERMKVIKRSLKCQRAGQGHIKVAKVIEKKFKASKDGQEHMKAIKSSFKYQRAKLVGCRWQ